VSNSRKKSLYFSDDDIREIEEQARRLDRSFSWVVQTAWFIAKKHIEGVPAHRSDT